MGSATAECGIEPMRLADEIICAIDDASVGKFDSALLHACNTIDAVSRRLFPREQVVGPRYVRALRQYLWLIEPMIGGGIDLVETRFENLVLGRKQNNHSPDFADVVYEVFRCSHAHGDEVPSRFAVSRTQGPFGSKWIIAKDELHMPDRVIWALLAVAVFARVHANQGDMGDYVLSLGMQQFKIKDWWGREDDFRPIAAGYNQVRVKMQGLDCIIAV